MSSGVSNSKVSPHATNVLMAGATCVCVPCTLRDISHSHRAEHDAGHNRGRHRQRLLSVSGAPAFRAVCFPSEVELSVLPKTGIFQSIMIK